MIAAYFGKGRDSKIIFDKLAVSRREWYTAHLNTHNVIYITFNEVSQNCDSYQEDTNRIENRIINDLIRDYPNVDIHEYTMASEEKYSDFFGLTDTEVDILFEKYQKMTPVQRITVIAGQAQDHMIILPKNR